MDKLLKHRQASRIRYDLASVTVFMLLKPYYIVSIDLQQQKRQAKVDDYDYPFYNGGSLHLKCCVQYFM